MSEHLYDLLGVTFHFVSEDACVHRKPYVIETKLLQTSDRMSHQP